MDNLGNRLRPGRSQSRARSHRGDPGQPKRVGATGTAWARTPARHARPLPRRPVTLVQLCVSCWHMLLVSTTRSRCMPTIPPLVITKEERAELQRRVRAHTTPQHAAKRARIVLLAADGLPNRQIAPIVGMNQHTVAQWRRRFELERLAGLTDRKRP